MTDNLAHKLALARDVEAAMIGFAADWKYIPTLPRGPKGERAILMMDYLYPDLQHIVAAHYISRGWRQHPELAIVKPRRIVGGIFEDLIAYVPVDQPDEPVVVGRDELPDTSIPDMSALPWSVKPKVNDIFERRPDDD